MTPSDLFSVDEAERESLEVEVVSERAPLGLRGRMLLREVRFTSQAWREGTVRIAGYLAAPLRGEPCPAMVTGAGDVERAATFVKRHGIACLCFDRPGVEQSTGPEDEYANWIHFDDPRESWMWHYIQAAMRAITYVRRLPEIDAERIGLTGYSRGGTMAFIANGVDHRIRVAVPQAAAGDIVRALDLGGWANYLHRDDDGRPHIPEAFYEFAKYYDPILYSATQHGTVMPIIGPQDEYFPLDTVRSTVEAIGPGCRLELIPNWDHTYFTEDLPEVDAFDNRRAFRLRTHRWLAASARMLKGQGEPPRMPTLELGSAASHADVCVRAEEPERVRRAWAWYSTDGAYTFESTRLSREGDLWVGSVPVGEGEMQRAAVYGELEYRRGAFISSLPLLGPEFRQRIRPFPEGK